LVKERDCQIEMAIAGGMEEDYVEEGYRRQRIHGVGLERAEMMMIEGIEMEENGIGIESPIEIGIGARRKNDR
jgi:hypothetical protein